MKLVRYRMEMGWRWDTRLVEESIRRSLSELVALFASLVLAVDVVDLVF